MKTSIVSVLLCIFAAPLAIPSSPLFYEHTQELVEKNSVFNYLLLHTYGAANPFLDIVYAIDTCIEVSQKTIISAAGTHTPESLSCADYCCRLLQDLDRQLSRLLSAFIHDEPKEEALKELIYVSTQGIIWLTTNAPEQMHASIQIKKLLESKKRFFMVNPSGIGTLLKIVYSGAVSICGLIVLKKIHDYITSVNHDRLTHLRETQLTIKKELKELEGKVEQLVEKDELIKHSKAYNHLKEMLKNLDDPSFLSRFKPKKK